MDLQNLRKLRKISSLMIFLLFLVSKFCNFSNFRKFCKNRKNSRFSQQNNKTTTNFIENWKITNYITFPPANSLWTNRGGGSWRHITKQEPEPSSFPILANFAAACTYAILQNIPATKLHIPIANHSSRICNLITLFFFSMACMNRMARWLVDWPLPSHPPFQPPHLSEDI